MEERQRQERLACPRLPTDVAAAWFAQAEKLDVYLEYEFTGAAALPIFDVNLDAAVNQLVTQAILKSSTLARGDRWFHLVLDQRPCSLYLECESAGLCGLDLSWMKALGAVTELTQYPDSYVLTVAFESCGDSAGGGVDGTRTF